MARFNNRVTDTIRGHEGAKSHKLSPELELYSIACTSLLEDQFYRKGSETMSRLDQLVKEADTQFVSNLAAYTRHEMHLRSVPMYLAALNAKHHSGGGTVRSTVKRVVSRADEISEVMAAYFAVNPNASSAKAATKASRGILRGVADVFQSGRFSEHQYSKYNRSRTAVKLKDALRLSRPRPRDSKQAELFKKILDDELSTAVTWETAQSKVGEDNKDKTEAEKAEAKGDKWAELIQQKKLGHMALLRNLRNILNTADESLTTNACEQLLTGVEKGKQFPYRYWTAYRELEKMTDRDPFKVKRVDFTLEGCLLKSAKNLPDFGRTVVATDCSGSMENPVSEKSSVTMKEIGLVLGSVLYNHDPLNTIMYLFGQGIAQVRNGHGILSVVRDCNRTNVGHSTNGHLVLNHLNQNKVKADNVMFFTDCQLHRSLQAEWNAFQRRNPEAKLWIFDLCGYNAVPIQMNGNVRLIAGWSDKIFDVVKQLEEGKKVVEMIRNYER